MITPSTKQLAILPMRPEHWDRVAEIYRTGIETKLATFETTVPAWEHWNSTHHTFARLIATYNDQIQGWAALSPVSSRTVYAGVAEVSVYIDAGFRGKGCGVLLLESLIAESERNNIWTLQASIFSENEPSLRLHHKCGFREVGHRQKIAKLDGDWKDTVLLERRSASVGVD